MKLKKLLAGVVASAMMLTMAVPAFAAGVIESEEGHTSYTLHKKYQLVGEGVSPAATFDFTVENVGVTGSSKYNASTMPTPTLTPSVTYAAGEATLNGTGTGDRELAVDFLKNGQLIYDSVGQYSYLLKETVPAQKLAGVEYDQSPITMKVTVVNDGTDGYKIKLLSFTKDGQKDDEAAFINTYTANKLNVAKVVNGDAGDKRNEFDFSVKFTGPDGKVWDASTAFTFAAGVKSAVYNSTTGTWDFTLTHGQSIDFTNIPAGVTYVVTENGLDASNKMTVNNVEYTADYENETGTMAVEALNATITNTAEGFIDMGVWLDNAPYMVLLSVVAAGAVWMLLRKRHTEN